MSDVIDPCSFKDFIEYRDYVCNEWERCWNIIYDTPIIESTPYVPCMFITQNKSSTYLIIVRCFIFGCILYSIVYTFVK